jgi:hypothetical protein
MCCGNKDDSLEKIQLKAKELAKKKGEIVAIYKVSGFYQYSVNPPADVTIIEYISTW